jgi:hypothetical protein
MEALRFESGVIQTYTGLAYDYANPDPASISLDDIAHALANACRFAGHTKTFCSVAEHCVRVSEIIERWEEASGITSHIPAFGLLHDAHEAYVWDCPAPFKPLLGTTYMQYADKADEAIIECLLPPNVSRNVFKLGIIKTADDCATVAEARLMMPFPPECWSAWEDRYSKVPKPPEGIFPAAAVGWDPTLAEEAFQARAHELGIRGAAGGPFG